MRAPKPLRLRVYYGDTDAGGVVYHPRYLEFFERARYELLHGLGFDLSRLTQEDVVFAVVAADVRYRKAARLGQELAVHTRLESCRGASLVLWQEARDAGSDELLCEARVRVGCLDRSLKPRRLPPQLAAVLRQPT